MVANESSSSKVFECTFASCSKRFTRRDYRDRHALNHNPQRGFSCPNCPKAYYREDVLKRHMTKHAKEARIEISNEGFLSDETQGSPGPDPVTTLSPHTWILRFNPSDVWPWPAETVHVLADNPIPRGCENSAVPDIQQIVRNLLGQTSRQDIEDWSSKATAFLLPESIEILLELFFTSFQDSYPIIHKMSLLESQSLYKSHLLLAAALIGAQYGQLQAETAEVAEVLYKRLRRELLIAVDEESADDLCFLQTLALANLYGLIWSRSPNSRQLACLYHSTVMRLLQRGGTFSMTPTAPLQRLTWPEWTQYEQKKRLGLFAISCEWFVVWLLGFPPTIDLCDIDLTLPCSPEFWTGESPLPDAGNPEHSLRLSALEVMLGKTERLSCASFGANAILCTITLLATGLRTNTKNVDHRDATVRIWLDEFIVAMWTFHHGYTKACDPRDSILMAYHAGVLLLANFNMCELRTAAGEREIGLERVDGRTQQRAIDSLTQQSKATHGTFGSWHAFQILSSFMEQHDQLTDSPFAAWLLYLAIMTIWVFGVSYEGLPVLQQTDRVYCSRRGDSLIIEPKLARASSKKRATSSSYLTGKAALSYLALYHPFVHHPNDFALVEGKNRFFGLLVYALHSLRECNWAIATVPRESMERLLVKCLDNTASDGRTAVEAMMQ